MRTDRKTTLKIGYREFVVSFVKGFKGSIRQIGECEFPLSDSDSSKGKIRVAKGLDPVEKGNTILHEVLHALFYTQGINVKPELEEHIVCALTNGLVAFMRDNPDYTTKLIRLLKKKPKASKETR